jgi:hypothetical protein
VRRGDGRDAPERAVDGRVRDYTSAVAPRLECGVGWASRCDGMLVGVGFNPRTWAPCGSI